MAMNIKHRLYLMANWFWVLFCAYLVAAWIFTVAQHGRSVYVYATILVVILIIYFFAEGLQVAYVDLHDKDDEQIQPDVLPALRRIRNDETKFFEGREWLVLVLVVCLTFLCNFDPVYLPFVGSLCNEFSRLLFTIAFTSFPALWLSQSTPKELARYNSESFLKLSNYLPVSVLIVGIGIVVQKLGMSAPSAMLQRLLCGSRVFARGRNLPPSDKVLFVSLLKRYGYGLYFLSKVYQIERDGAADLVSRGLLYYVSGHRSEFEQTFSCGQPPPKGVLVRLKGFSAPPLHEKLDAVAPAFEAILAGHDPGKDFRKLDDVNYYKAEFISKGNDLVFQIRMPYGVPEGVTDAYGHRVSALVLYYEVHLKTAPGLFTSHLNADDFDHHWHSFKIPCRQYQLDVHADGFGFGDFHANVSNQESVHQGEANRLSSVVTRRIGNLQANLFYPLPGFIYEVRWRLWSKRSPKKPSHGLQA